MTWFRRSRSYLWLLTAVAQLGCDSDPPNRSGCILAVLIDP